MLRRGCAAKPQGRALAGPWQMQVGLLGEALHVPTEAGAAMVPWQPVVGAAAVDRITWLKAVFDAPADWASPEALALDLAGGGKGHVYVNGFDCGRYWVRDPVLSTYYQLPPDNLKPKGNLLVLFEELGVADLSKVRVVRRGGGGQA